MVSVGLRALPQRRLRNSVWTGDMVMGGKEDRYIKQGGRSKGMNRKSVKGQSGFDHSSANNSSGRGANRNSSRNFSNYRGPPTSHIRKVVDPETVKYFSEIANVLDSRSVDAEEKEVICGNAMEETRGKEFELSTDYNISHTMEALLEGCDLDHLCNFLLSCGRDLSLIAMDRSGSHVIEKALTSVAGLLQNTDSWSIIEDTLRKICEMIVESPLELMSNSYGSHVLRRLLSLCRRVPLDTREHNHTKSRTSLAEHLKPKDSQNEDNKSQHVHQGFPDVFRFLLFEMLGKSSKKDVSAMLVDQQCSLVLQTALRLLVGLDDALMQIIQILLGISSGNSKAESIDVHRAQKFLNLMKDNAFSHLMEVILEVAPHTIYDELLKNVFTNALVDLSLDSCGNFVIQALIAHARSKEHMELIWNELRPCFKDLLATGKPGVIGFLIIASQRLDTHGHECCKALIAAVASDSPLSIVPRLLFLENYFYCNEKSNWKSPSGVRMHVMGSMILQAVFRYSSAFIQPYINSITSMEAEFVFEMAKDHSGSRVLEAFFCSNASGKYKRKIVAKLKGHFGELSVKPSGSYTVEKCYNVSNVSLKEMIVSEVLPMRNELSKTKQGPLLLTKFDVDGFARQPDQWRSRLKTKDSVLKDFYATFGPDDQKYTKSSQHFLSDEPSDKKDTKADRFLSTSDRTKEQNSVKSLRMEIDQSLSASFLTSKNKSGTKRPSERDQNAKSGKEDRYSKKRKKDGNKA